MRNLLVALAAMLFPVVANAQQAKPSAIADYVSFCLALWTNSPDAETKANALGLQSGIANGARVTIGKSTIQFYKSGQGGQNVTAITTAFADGKETSCDVNLGPGIERTDLESLQRALGLDGQILPIGPATIGYWKMPDKGAPILVKVLVSSRVATLNVQEFEAAASGETSRH
jgi:hypothetical protein